MLQREELLRYLSGSGIEIGALHRPCVVPHLSVQYLDRLTRDQALEHYPELKGEPIVEPHILDDAETLSTIGHHTQDFVIANHVIEHMANPIGALLAWARVVRVGGRIFLAIPDKHATFDRGRDKTDIRHLIDDYNEPSSEKDYAHFEDFALNVSCRTFHLRPESEHKQLARELWDMGYSIHYHVWDYASFSDFIKYMVEVYFNGAVQVLKTRATVGEEFIFVLERVRE